MAEESGDEMQIIKGIAASNGIAIGNLKLCVKLDDKIVKQPITDVDAELSVLNPRRGSRSSAKPDLSRRSKTCGRRELNDLSDPHYDVARR